MKKIAVWIVLPVCLLVWGVAMAEHGREFQMDQALETDNGLCHYNLYVPESYDGSTPYALHIALPGWEGLYFQGVGEDLRWEYLPYESGKYVEDMIVVSAQLNDWGMTSAGGGETLSRVMELRPDLYAAALFVSSQWDGDPAPLVEARTPLYLFTAEHDSYYGCEPVRRAYQRIHDLDVEGGLSEEEIAGLLVMDIRSDAQLDALREEHADLVGTAYAMDYHGAGMLAAFDADVMNWVFTQR